MIADRGPAAPACPSINRRKGLPGRSTSLCPRTSSRDRGRIRTASGGIEAVLASGPSTVSRELEAKRLSSAPVVTVGRLYLCLGLGVDSGLLALGCGDRGRR